MKIEKFTTLTEMHVNVGTEIEPTWVLFDFTFWHVTLDSYEYYKISKLSMLEKVNCHICWQKLSFFTCESPQVIMYISQEKCFSKYMYIRKIGFPESLQSFVCKNRIRKLFTVDTKKSLPIASVSCMSQFVTLLGPS